MSSSKSVFDAGHGLGDGIPAAALGGRSRFGGGAWGGGALLHLLAPRPPDSRNER